MKDDWMCFVDWCNLNEEKISNAVFEYSEIFSDLNFELSDSVSGIAHMLYAEERESSFCDVRNYVDEIHAIEVDEMLI